MATISRENIGQLTDKLTVTLSKDDYLPAFEQSLKKYAKSANIPGFRKGMVPAGMIKKMYGPGVFTEEVIRTVEKELTQYIQEQQLELFGQPIPLDGNARQLDMNNPSDVVFSFEIGLMPKVEIDLKNITVTRHRVNVTDKMIDDEINRLSTRFGKMREKDEVTSEEDVINVSFVESNAEGTDIEGSAAKSNSLLVKYFREGFRQNVMGKRKGDDILLRLDEAFDEKEREWLVDDLGPSQENDEADNRFYKMNIAAIGIIEKAEMNESFYSRVFPHQAPANEDDFRNAIRESIQSQWDAQTRTQLHDQIFHQLVDHTHVDLPEEFLKKSISEGRLKTSKTAEEAGEDFSSYANSMKWTLIGNRLIDQFDVHVSSDEIKRAAKQQLIGYMQGQLADEDAPWLDNYVQGQMKDKKFVDETYRQIQTNKLFNILEGQVNVIENTVTPEELVSMQHHHHH